MYLSYREIDGYNAMINQILTTRGYGKTYGWQDKVLKHVERNKGRKFMYLVRRKVDIDILTEQEINPFKNYMIDNFNKYFNEDGKEKLIINKKGFFFDNERVGYIFPISEANKIKRGSGFADVDYIIWDEFLIDRESKEKYLPNEPKLFMSLVDTVVRNRKGVKVYMLGNALVFYNPYNIYWNIDKPYKKDAKLFQNGKILVYVKAPKEFIEYRKHTDVGELMQGTDYEQMALYNRFQGESNGFIRKKDKGARFMCTLYLEGQKIGIWVGDYCFYVSPNYNLAVDERYCFDIFSQQQGVRLLTKSIRNTPVETVINAYKIGLVFFENQKVKDIFMRVLTKFI